MLKIQLLDLLQNILKMMNLKKFLDRALYDGTYGYSTANIFFYMMEIVSIFNIELLNEIISILNDLVFDSHNNQLLKSFLNATIDSFFHCQVYNEYFVHIFTKLFEYLQENEASDLDIFDDFMRLTNIMLLSNIKEYDAVIIERLEVILQFINQHLNSDEKDFFITTLVILLNSIVKLSNDNEEISSFVTTFITEIIHFLIEFYEQCVDTFSLRIFANFIINIHGFPDFGDIFTKIVRIYGNMITMYPNDIYICESLLLFDSLNGIFGDESFTEFKDGIINTVVENTKNDDICVIGLSYQLI